jgi:hypothetical protein
MDRALRRVYLEMVPIDPPLSSGPVDENNQHYHGDFPVGDGPIDAADKF